MKLLLIVDAYLPSKKSSAKLFRELAMEMRDRGHEPVVLAPAPELDAPSSVNSDDGFEVIRVRSGVMKGAETLAERALNEWRLSSRIWHGARTHLEDRRFDGIVFYSPTIFFGELVRRLKRLWGCPAYLILRDIFPQWAIDSGVMSRWHPAAPVFRYKERQQYRAADIIAVQSPANLEYFRETGLDRLARMEVLYNWVTPSPPPEPKTEFRERFGLAGKFVFFFGGNVGIAQDMDALIRLAEGLRAHPSLHVLVVGEGSRTAYLQQAIRERGLDNISYHPSVDQQTYPSLLAEFDVGLINLHHSLTTHNFPGKLLGYLNAGMPTLAHINDGNDLETVLVGHGAGLVSRNGDDATLLEHALSVARDDRLRRRLSEGAGRLLREVFETRHAVDRILASLGEPEATR